MMIDSEELKEYVNYVCEGDHDVMAKKTIMYIIELLEDSTKRKGGDV